MPRKRLKKKITIDNIYYTYPYRHKPDSPYFLEKKQYKKISDDFYELLSKAMIDTGFVFDLPLRLGEILIVKFKSNKKHIDWKTTKQLGQTIYHRNNHSEGYAARLWWNCSKWLKYHNIFKIKLTRHNSRYLSSQIKKENSILYYPVN